MKQYKGKALKRVIDEDKISDDAIRKAVQAAIDDAEPADSDYPQERGEDD